MKILKMRKKKKFRVSNYSVHFLNMKLSVHLVYLFFALINLFVYLLMSSLLKKIKIQLHLC